MGTIELDRVLEANASLQCTISELRDALAEKEITISGMAETKHMLDDRVTELKAELRKWQQLPDEENLRAIAEQANQHSLAAKQVYINGLLHLTAHLKTELAEVKEKIEKYQRFWEWSRLADKENFERSLGEAFDKISRTNWGQLK